MLTKSFFFGFQTTETVNNSSRQTAELESALREASERYDQLCVSHKRLQADYEQLTSHKIQSDQQMQSMQQENLHIDRECQELKHTIDVSWKFIPLTSLG